MLFQLDVPTTHPLQGTDTVACGIPGIVVGITMNPSSNVDRSDGDSWLRVLSSRRASATSVYQCPTRYVHRRAGDGASAIRSHEGSDVTYVG